MMLVRGAGISESALVHRLPGKPIALSPGGGTRWLTWDSRDPTALGAEGRLRCRDGDRAASKQLTKTPYPQHQANRSAPASTVPRRGLVRWARPAVAED